MNGSFNEQATLILLDRDFKSCFEELNFTSAFKITERQLPCVHVINSH